MAGSYPDVPGHRFAYDRDGTTFYRYSGWQPSTMTQANVEALNSDIASWTDAQGSYGEQGPNKQIVLIFPQARTLSGIYVRGAGYLSAPVYTSTNTTNGIDGTWTQVTYPGHTTSLINPSYRTGITTVTGHTGINGVRIEANTSRYNFDDWWLYNVHLYGTITGAGSRLAIWHPTLDQEVGPAYFDWGNSTRNSGNVDLPFRVKNLSSTLQANTITLGLNTISDYSPTFLSQHSVNYNAGAFASSVSLGNLAAGAISATCNVRRNIIPSAVLGLFTVRITASAATWA